MGRRGVPGEGGAGRDRRGEDGRGRGGSAAAEGPPRQAATRLARRGAGWCGHRGGVWNEESRWITQGMRSLPNVYIYIYIQVLNFEVWLGKF